MKKYFEIAKEKFDALQQKKDVIVLGVESSCDETSIAIVKNGREILANVVSSQIEIHKRFGGVVPEVASRNHILAVNNVLNECLKQANLTLNDIDAVAVTYGAGLVGALMVGVNFAKSLAYALGVPLIAVSHVDGHISANYLTHQELKPPFLCLMVSGGHTALLNIKDYCVREKLGSTIDDAVGEAFDKVARVLGLPYPGGVQIDNLAKTNVKPQIKFLNHEVLKGTLNFSFSGLKTAVINFVHNAEQKNQKIDVPQVCASFQSEAVGQLCAKAMEASKFYGNKKLVVAGGVGANSCLKETLTGLCNERDIKLFSPKLSLCTDNGAMIASAGYFYIKAGKGFADLTLTASPVVKL